MNPAFVAASSFILFLTSPFDCRSTSFGKVICTPNPSKHRSKLLITLTSSSSTPSSASSSNSPTSNTNDEQQQQQQAEVFSAWNMTVSDFFSRSIGTWKSQRSSHNLAWAHFESVNSDIVIESLSLSDSEVIEICEKYDTAMDSALCAIRMSWEGTSDWDEDEVLKGSTVLVVVKNEQGGDKEGKLLRSEGYAETIPAVGEWKMTEDGVFILNTFYDRAAAEERIWFATKDLRMRVSMIKTSAGTGVLNASFSSEIRQHSPLNATI
uniref:THAP4-like heme-binding beta-barrel domain-containing protein n=1 Tax=Timspurckia oligopyrenoides TaxID=708627 RepID=A0A7S1ET48_9RHOD|mmetsp:Transcript_5365/g.9429  ORF Transcript_5365/g.9429 Transcript_5365/m.9429 type:complete len:266 (+) Transcript_5365:149-946(+)